MRALAFTSLFVVGCADPVPTELSWKGEKVIDETDDTFSAGVVGQWTKADSITRLDDLTVVAR